MGVTILGQKPPSALFLALVVIDATIAGLFVSNWNGAIMIERLVDL